MLATVAGCATAPKGVDKEAKPADIDSLKTVGAKANAQIVFASSRAGTSHLFSMKSDGSELKQLTKSGLTDWNPRFSPDGSKILFSRSVEKGASETDAGVDHAWDLFTISADGQAPTKVVPNATWGSWISKKLSPALPYVHHSLRWAASTKPCRNYCSPSSAIPRKFLKSFAGTRVSLPACCG